MDISVIIPALNAARELPVTLAALGRVKEVIVVDGGSDDDTQAVAAKAGARVLISARGRGTQLAAGVAAAGRDWLLLLHADTRLQDGWRSAAAGFMQAGASRAAYFRFTLDSADPRARRLEQLVSWRCRKLALPYGDQGLLVHRDLLQSVGGIRPMPLMEDVDLIRRRAERLTGLDAAAVTSAARWERDGWYRRSARNLICLSLYFAGLPPRTIARLYA